MARYLVLGVPFRDLRLDSVCVCVFSAGPVFFERCFSAIGLKCVCVCVCVFVCVCPHKQHFSAFPSFVPICLAICPHMHHLFAHATFDRTCTICLHMQHLTAHAQFYRLRSDFLLPPQAFLQCFSVSWTPASSSRYSDGLALQLAPHLFDLRS